MTIINAEAPVALHLETYSNGETVVNPLTTCCAASAKGCADCIACRACYSHRTCRADVPMFDVVAPVNMDGDHA